VISGVDSTEEPPPPPPVVDPSLASPVRIRCTTSIPRILSSKIELVAVTSETFDEIERSLIPPPRPRLDFDVMRPSSFVPPPSDTSKDCWDCEGSENGSDAIELRCCSSKVGAGVGSRIASNAVAVGISEY